LLRAGTAARRAKLTGHSTRQHTSTSTAQTTRSVTPSQPVSNHVNPASARTRDTTGCRMINRTSQKTNRHSCAMAMIQPGVRYTGARQTGNASGSGLRSWAT
jgi:hypothetical protein